MARNSFLLFMDYEEKLKSLSNEDLGVLLRGIFKYEKTSIAPNFNSPLLSLAWDIIQVDLDKNREEYEKKCSTNKANGEKGGRPPKTEQLSEEPKITDGFSKNPEEPNGFSQNPTEPKKPYSDMICNDILLVKENINNNARERAVDIFKRNVNYDVLECISDEWKAVGDEVINTIFGKHFELADGNKFKFNHKNWDVDMSAKKLTELTEKEFHSICESLKFRSEEIGNRQLYILGCVYV